MLPGRAHHSGDRFTRAGQPGRFSLYGWGIAPQLFRAVAGEVVRRAVEDIGESCPGEPPTDGLEGWGCRRLLSP